MSEAQRASVLRALHASDIWAALRLPANAAADVVRQAFRRESRLLHPDKNPLPEAEAAFKKLRSLLPKGPPPSAVASTTADAADAASVKADAAAEQAALASQGGAQGGAQGA